MEAEKSYQKKMTAYLDGTLPAQEKSEFEAYVATHPEFLKVFNKKREELEFLKSLIPQALMTEESQKSLLNEIKFSAKQLLDETDSGIFGKIKSFFNR